MKASSSRKVVEEQFSVKNTTNKDLFFPFKIETVSDAFTTVKLKKNARDL